MIRIRSSLLALLVVSALFAPRQAAAQENGSGPLVRYGKWVLAAGAIGMNLLAADAHNRADDAFDEIERACFEDDIHCILGPDGRYAEQRMENLYQASLRYDRRARRWLIAGEAALLGAATMFVLELTRKKHEPDNIPFEPEIRSLRQATGVGVRVAW